MRSTRKPGGAVCAEGRRVKIRPEWSQRLLGKGVLVKETYEVFAAWDDSLTESQNLKATLSGRYSTAGWEREVESTLLRLRHIELIRPLITLAKGGMSVADSVCVFGSAPRSSPSTISGRSGCSSSMRRAVTRSGRNCKDGRLGRVRRSWRPAAAPTPQARPCWLRTRPQPADTIV